MYYRFFGKKKKTTVAFFRLVKNAVIDACSTKWSMFLARIKTRLEFQSMEAFWSKPIKKSKKNAYPHKFRSSNRSARDLRPSTNVYKLFALEWLGITVPRDNFLWNGRFKLNATLTNTYSFVGVRKMNHTGILLYIRKHFWRFKFIKIILFS